MKSLTEPSDLGTMTTDSPSKGRRGRPSKRLPQIVMLFLKQLSAGESRRRAALAIPISSKTIQRWLREDAMFRRSVQEAEREGQDKARYLRWLNHPFRGLRPPLPKHQLHLPRPHPRFAC
jgi:hypothetical protein